MSNKLKSYALDYELYSILSLYNNKLPFSVAEYFCYVYRNNITCNKKLGYGLFKPFLPYRKYINYVFSDVVSKNDMFADNSIESPPFIILNGVEVLIPKNRENDFMERYSNFIFSSSSDSGIEWVDEDENAPEFDSQLFSGICRLLF